MIENAIAQLPQFSVLDQSNTERWIVGIKRYHGDRALWHAGRLRGLGGSEIGAVIRGVKELEESGFSTHKRVVEHKLLKRMPEFQTGAMTRGTNLEELARLAFMYRYEAAQDLGALKQMATGAPRPGYEWLIGNPDDINMLRGRRWVNDFKVPTTYSEEVDFDYVAQLHHYALIARFAGVKIDGLLLTKLDLAPELGLSLSQKVPTMSRDELHSLARSIATTNVPGMRIVSHVVDMSRDMDLDILDCGSFLWNEHVLKGIVPVFEKKPLVELPDDKLINIGLYQQQYAMAKAGIKQLEAIAKTSASAIADTLGDADISGRSMPLGLVKVEPKPVDKTKLIDEAISLGATVEELQSDKKEYSIVALVEEIKRLQGNPESEHLFNVTTTNDAAKAEAYLVERGFDISTLRADGVSVKLSTKAIHKDISGVYERAAGDVFHEWIAEHSFTGERQVRSDALGDDLDDLGLDALEAASGTLQEWFADAPEHHADDELSKTNSPMSFSASMR